MSTAQDAARREAIAGYEVVGSSIADLEGLVWLAARLCGSSKAVVNIIDDRWQHQVAAWGVEASVCTRADSMCDGLFEGREQVVVSDARADPRFADNPFVTGRIGHVRFYASSPLVTPDGIPIGTLCVFDEEVREIDDEERRGLEILAHQVVDVLELRRAGRLLRQSNRRLESFAGQIGHDLRNPLTAVAGYIELAESSPDLDEAPDVRTWLGRAHAVTGRMHAMISDVLQFASLSGAEPRTEQLDLPAVVEAVRDDLAHELAASGAELTSDVDVPAVGDATLVRAVLQNLVANAVKFRRGTAAPHVRVHAAAEGDVVRIMVDDDGPGVPPEERARVFGLLERGAASEEPGLGIGLATCRRIVEAHGGRMGIEDSPLGGARVWLTLPVD